MNSDEIICLIKRADRIYFEGVENEERFTLRCNKEDLSHGSGDELLCAWTLNEYFNLSGYAVSGEEGGCVFLIFTEKNISEATIHDNTIFLKDNEGLELKITLFTETRMLF